MKQDHKTSYGNQYNLKDATTGINTTSYDPTGTNPIPPPSLSTTTTTNNSDDYLISSEEEFQIQLALAISVSNSEFQEDEIQLALAISVSNSEFQEDCNKDQPDDSGIGKDDDDAELLSRRYWDYNVLDYDDKVIDGFYDINGLSMDSSSQGKIPSLAEMKRNLGESSFEVVIVNRATDPSLEVLIEVAHHIALDCTNVGHLVQRLAELVTEHMGGSISHDNKLLTMWTDITAQFRLSLLTNVLPIGSLNIGLSRHRALLFKVLADKVGVPCRLVKRCWYTGLDDAVVSIIKLDSEREFLVDLMSAPGTLTPVGVLSFKNPRLSRTPELGSANDSGFELSSGEAMCVEHIDAKGKNIVIEDSPFVPEKMLLDHPSSSTASNGSPAS